MIAPTPQELVEILRKPLDELPDPLVLCPVPGPFDVTIRPPGSKSLMNRALLLAALAEGESFIDHPLLDAIDAQVLIRALTALGTEFDLSCMPESLIVRGTGGRLKGGCTLELENAGTATRFLIAAACFADAPVVIDGNDRMRQRPQGELLGFLRQLGIKIDELGEPGCVPLRIHPHRPKGGTIEVGTTASSQFVSALMLIAPLTSEGVTIRFTGEATSASYINLTANQLYACIKAREGWYEIDGSTGERYLGLPPCEPLRLYCMDLEPDASGASYFWGAATVIEAASSRIPSLASGCLQGDANFRDVLRNLQGDAPVPLPGANSGAGEPDGTIEGHGVIEGLEIDLSLMPDTAQTLAAVACFADGTTTIRGLRTLRVKETDRIAALQTELARIGVTVEPFSYMTYHGTPDEGVRITPPSGGGGVDCSESAPPVEFDTYDDHRMAMSLALIGLRRPNVAIRDPGCVRKTYPTFWQHWSLLYESALAGGEPRGPGGLE